MSLLPDHVASMEAWLDLVDEVVVVDSESRDGTAEFLQKRLPGARHFGHPPGLYQSWNFGIRQIASTYTYISTVGDSMTREGLLHLHEVARRQAADVVVSPPDFVDEAGRPARCNDWPVHDMIAFLQLSDDVCMEGLALFLVALAYIPFAILGSSASNLYRTETLRDNPLPTEYGLNGDGAWGLMHALQIRLAITPRRVSCFRRHRKSYAAHEYDAPDGDRRMLEAALTLLAERLEADADLQRQARELDAQTLILAKRTVQQWRARLQGYRKRMVPWIFEPRAWHARGNRDVSQRHCLALLRQLLRAHPPVAAVPAAALHDERVRA